MPGSPLAPVWEQVVALLDDNISIIPVRDKDEIVHGKTLTRKSPYREWAKYQTQRATKEELWFLLEKYETTGIGMICGAISGNLEAIDIDSKWLPGIALKLFLEIKTALPGLVQKLRIHRTPSGGYHLLYRIEQGCIVPASKKLAGRPATDTELSKNPKDKVKYFIESRGEAAYVAAPPALGYFVIRPNPLPILTMEERNSLIAICESFNQVIKEAETYKTSVSESKYYDVNPFEDFNKNPDAERVLIDNGWTYHSKCERAAHFTRPGSQSGGIHASFLFAKRLYKFWTTHTEFDNDRYYKPATVYGKLVHGGNMVQVYGNLVKRGYGKMKASVERKLVTKKAMMGEPIVANVSEEAAQSYIEQARVYELAHKFGIFWDIDEKGKIVINRMGLQDVAVGMGYRLHLGDPVRIMDKFIHRRTTKEVYNDLLGYIRSEDANLLNDIQNKFDEFFEHSHKHAIGVLKDLEQDIVLQDTKLVCYKFFRNGYLHITAKSVELCPYSNITGLIWAERVQDRDFVMGVGGGMFVEFMKLAVNFERGEEYIKSIIGYLSHEYKNESTGYIIVLTEECEDPRFGGGSGKNVFCNLLKLTTTLCNVPGSQMKLDQTFLQAWNGERIMTISDVPKTFDFLFLKEPSTGSGKLKKLYKDEVVIPCELMPKFLVQTNYSYEVKDGGLARRIKQIEFTNFFTKTGGVDIHFGGMFPQCWASEDWIGYDNFIVECIQVWLKSELKIESYKLSSTGWRKQFEQTYGENTHKFIEQHWEKWTIDMNGEVDNEEFAKQYDEYCRLNSIAHNYRISSIKMNRALTDYSKKNKWEYNQDGQYKDNMGNKRRRKEFNPPF